MAVIPTVLANVSIQQLRAADVQDGDVLLLSGMRWTMQEVEQISKQLRDHFGGKTILVLFVRQAGVRLDQLPDAEMNLHGWYRKPATTESD